MEYRVEVFDRAGLRVGRFRQVPLLEVRRTGPDLPDHIEGLLPVSLAEFGVGYRVAVYVAERLVVSAFVTSVRPAWGEVRRLIVDRYVNFQELLSFEAEADGERWNGSVAVRFQHTRIDTMIRSAINRARGPVHYTVAHTAYPDGAQREYGKFSVRQENTAALPVGAIDSGQWVDGARINASAAVAKDGDTISGLVVDGVAWPDLRLMMIDCEEMSRNSHAIGRHPEVAEWDEGRYGRSVYKQRAEAAKARLQAYIDTKGIDFIELNPHVDGSGNYDDRVDAYGRYLGLVYGGGECFNAGLVEEGLADVYLYADGRYHDPELALKDFYSYGGVHVDSIVPCPTVVGAFEMRGGVLEVVAALSALADGYVFSVDLAGAVTVRRGREIDAVVRVDPVETGVELGRELEGLVNLLRLVGNPQDGAVDGYHAEQESIDALGTAFRYVPFFALSRADDAAKMGQGLLRDLAWPARVGQALFYQGVASVSVGDLLEFRGEQLVERDRMVAAGWSAEFGERFVARVTEITQRLAGETVETQLALGSPYRSVTSPLNFITRSQDSLSAFFEFRLDDEVIGLDIGYHLD